MFGHFFNIIHERINPFRTNAYFYCNTYQPAFTCLKFTIETPEQSCEICLKLPIKTPERRQWRRSGVFIVNFEHISHLALCFYCQL